MERGETGFREREHTADWQLQVWAPDIPTLFAQAALGMYRLSGAQLAPDRQVEYAMDLHAEDLEGLLVAFLDELLYLGEAQGLGFTKFDLEIQGAHLIGRLTGGTLQSQDKEIKAVTFHNLLVRRGERGYEVDIVFDV